MGNAAAKLSYSIEDYLEIEQSTLEKYEYADGEIFAMAGGTLPHSLLSNNAGGGLREAFKRKGKSCRVYNSDAKIAISDSRYSYADALVVCGKTETSPNLREAVTNPIIIVEVLSESTALYDREGKFQAYQQMPSLQEYVLISQDKMLVEVFYKDPSYVFWQYRSYQHIEETITLQSVDITISLTDLYLGWEKPEEKKE